MADFVCAAADCLCCARFCLFFITDGLTRPAALKDFLEPSCIETFSTQSILCVGVRCLAIWMRAHPLVSSVPVILHSVSSRTTSADR